MDVTASMDAPCSVGDLFAHVDRLDGYPAWMPLAHAVRPLPGSLDVAPAWDVELRARVGPFARSKRLRMVRTKHLPESATVRFERCELDDRAHSAWILDAVVNATNDGSRLDMALHYGGALWTGGVMERVLVDQISAGREQLLALVARSPA